MSTKQSLDLVIHISAERRNSAALGLAGSRRQTDEAKRKLDQLHRYRNDYLGRLNGSNEAGNTDLVRMANTRAFLDKLEQAIGQQQSEIEACESYANACFHVLSAEEKKLKSLETLREHRVQEIGRARNRQDQKRTDEFGARASRSGGASFEYRSA